MLYRQVPLESSLLQQAMAYESGKVVNRHKDKKRLTFTFPFVHHQSHDWKVEH